MDKKNIFISFSFDSSNHFKKELEEKLRQSGIAVNYSEKKDRSDLSDETIWKYLKDRISGSSIMLIIYSEDLEKGFGGKACKTKDKYAGFTTSHFWGRGQYKTEGWIYKEIKCALRDGMDNRINGIIVLVPKKFEKIFNLDKTLNNIPILKANFENYNYKTNDKFEKSYIPWLWLEDFYENIDKYIIKTFEKRNNKNHYTIVKNEL